MEAAILISIGIILLVIGLVSCVLPPLPGPPIAYIALLIAAISLNKTQDLPNWLLIVYAIITVFILIIDNFIPVWSTKKFGGTKAGIRGCFIGIVIGIIFSPFGGISIILCPFLGAIIGEIVDGQSLSIAVKSGIGSFIGFLLTSGIKIILVLFMCYHYFKAVF
ncbi:MAG: DUF456 domain-containing protein [Chitinophagales bacterium]|nr:DUF456 domain-containing protein [Chitinophagales bacterium]HMW13120.1 DUF456 domain-containing protein [Chitinophagales bacterium]HMX61102.1 DUF456 domain-containing protein [Chitinophagales bacterium]HMY23524.1 DUF456 domain-containing protein [Chitinophagales bacterium]HMZ33586.1 DUF456 domain-containing protein [Chitinophagales bacterium]